MAVCRHSHASTTHPALQLSPDGLCVTRWRLTLWCPLCLWDGLGWEQVKEWSEFVPALNQGCLCLTPFCDEGDKEDEVKERSRAEALEGAEEDVRESASVAAKTLCKPYDQPGCRISELEPIEGLKCFYSGQPAKAWVLWGRSY